MATTQPTPDTSPDRAQDLRWQPPPGPYPGDPQQTASGPYTATDAGAGVTTDSLQAWQTHRAEFGTFVRADIAGVAGSAGPPYAGRPGAAPVAPNLVLTDDSARQLAMNGTPCGFDGEGPCAAARILAAEGLLTEQAALPTITGRHQLTVHRAAPAPGPGVLPDTIALDPAQLQLWSAQQRWQRGLQRARPAAAHRPELPRAGRRSGPRRRRRRRRAGRPRAGRPGRPPAGRQPRPGTALPAHVDLRHRRHVAPPPTPARSGPTAPAERQPAGRPAPTRTGPRR